MITIYKKKLKKKILNQKTKKIQKNWLNIIIKRLDKFFRRKRKFTNFTMKK